MIMTQPAQLHKELIDVMGDAVVVCDRDGNIIVWNPAAVRMFGHSEAEVLGKSLDMIIPERLRQRHHHGYMKTMETGVTRYGNDVLQVPAINNLGEPMSIAFTVAMTRSNDGQVSSIVSVIRDETERFAKDRANRKHIAELEETIKNLTTAKTL
jgi:PAS domain S-box-containing protein